MRNRPRSCSLVVSLDHDDRATRSPDFSGLVGTKILAWKPGIIFHNPDVFFFFFFFFFSVISSFLSKTKFLNFMGMFYEFSLIFESKEPRFRQKLGNMMSSIKI